MKKYVIILNGKPTSGKDKLVDSISKPPFKMPVSHTSSIIPIKEAASLLGWNKQKDDKSRKFLSDLKKLSTEYNDYPTEYILSTVQTFLEDSDDQALFIDIREPDEIRKTIDKINNNCEVYLKEGDILIVKSLLIKRDGEDINRIIGNSSDDNIYDYEYDYTYNNITSDSDYEIAENFYNFLKLNVWNINISGNEGIIHII